MKAAARRNKQANAQSIADLLDSDDDCSESDSGRHASTVIVAAEAVGELLDKIQEVVIEYKRKLFTGMVRAPILNMDDVIIQQITDMLPLKRWSVITSAVCNWTKKAYSKGHSSQVLMSMQKPTSWIVGNFNEIAEHHWQFRWLKFYHPHELTTHEAKKHAMQCQLPNSYAFKPCYHGHSEPNVTSEQICLDHLAWLQDTNRYDFQYLTFGERVRNHDMFTLKQVHFVLW